MNKKPILIITSFFIKTFVFGQCEIELLDKHLCFDEVTTNEISITPVVTGAEEPYKIMWSYNYTVPGTSISEDASDILNDVTLLEPTLVATPYPEEIYLKLSIEDNNGSTCKDSLKISRSEFYSLAVDERAFITKGESITIYSGGNTNYPPYTYEWTPNINMNDSTLETPTVSPVVDTKYFAYKTDAKGCRFAGNDYQIFVTVTGDNSEIEKSSLTLYPNPVANKVCISSYNDLSELDIQITDANGTIVETITSGDYIDTSELAEGIYVVSIYKAGKLLSTEKIIKQ